MTGIISGIFIAILAVGCVLIAIDLNNVISAEKIVGIFVDVLMLAGLLYIFCSLFRSYVIIGDYEIRVTANVGKNNPLVYKNQNAFTLRYDKIEGLSLTERSPNPSVFLRSMPYFLTLVLQTEGNDRYITLHYFSDKQICQIIDLLLEKVALRTGKKLSENNGAAMLAEYFSGKKRKRGIMSILDVDKKYESKDVLTSFNYGKTLSSVNRRVILGMAILLVALDFGLVVTLLVLLFTNQWQSEMWIIAVVIVVVASVITLIAWLLKRADNSNRMLEDSLIDAIETVVVITNEVYYYQDGSCSLSHVAHFNVDGVDYAITYNKSSVQPKDRKDIIYLLDEYCRALYSPKNNDLLILGAIKSADDGEIV